MRYIKTFEARKTYAVMARDLRSKFMQLGSQADRLEIEDVLRPISDLVGEPRNTYEYIRYSYIDKPQVTGTIWMSSGHEDADSYRAMRSAYDNMIHGNLKMALTISFEFADGREGVVEAVEEELSYLKETLASMGYSTDYSILFRENPSKRMFKIDVSKEDLDVSSIIDEKEYYSHLPRAIIKPFDMFMLQYKVPEDKAAEFAALLGSADWTALG